MIDQVVTASDASQAFYPPTSSDKVEHRSSNLNSIHNNLPPQILQTNEPHAAAADEDQHLGSNISQEYS